MLEQAINFHQNGQLAEAAALYQQILAQDPQNADAWHLLGVIELQCGNAPAAVALIDRALAIAPHPGFLANRGNALQQLGRVQDALVSYDQALALEPNSPEVLNGRGNVMRSMQRPEEALVCYERAITLHPQYAEALNNRGAVLHDLKRYAEAVASYDQSLALAPDYVEALGNRGAALQELRRFDEALASYDRVLAITPDQVVTLFNRGNLLQEMKRLDEALASYDRALAIMPDYVEALCNRGATLRDLGRFEAALASYDHALAVEPDYVIALYNRGHVLLELSRFDDAVASYDRALAIEPTNANALNSRANALIDRGRLPEAIASYQRALEADPGLIYALSNLLFAHNYWAEGSPTEPLAEARRFGELVARFARPYTSWREGAHDRLRVGFVSGDLRVHPVGYFFESIAAALGASPRLELYAYLSRPCVDAISQRIQRNFKVWRPVDALNDEALAKQIHDDGVDILIDLSGHTAHNRLPVFAWKPAPVQATWLGYFATTGVIEIDYLIADPWTVPEGEEAHFTEQIWRLPEGRLCFTAPDVSVEVGPLPALREGRVTFGCFNNFAKMTDAVAATWARVMAAVPSSRLFLKSRNYDNEAVRADTVARFAKQGVAPDRLMFEGIAPRADYFAAYNRVDIALDPFPYPGGATSVEALWMGIPVLTKAGDRFISHQGETIAHSAGVADWIASDADDYVAKAVAFAADLDHLAALRAGLRAQVLSSPLFDAARFSRHFEDALMGMWEQRRKD